ncbi:MAG: hypothetical protein IJ915_09050 [Paludibacteraceae bacterium]|nr:hypothetical protein [Paludibacteraceae bacterium]
MTVFYSDGLWKYLNTDRVNALNVTDRMCARNVVDLDSYFPSTETK